MNVSLSAAHTPTGTGPALPLYMSDEQERWQDEDAREHFDKGDWYWSRSEHHGWPWAVGFEGGSVNSYGRGNEFRVRPFRCFTHSSI